MGLGARLLGFAAVEPEVLQLEAWAVDRAGPVA